MRSVRRGSVGPQTDRFVAGAAIHKEIAKQFRNAMVWGSSAKHSRGQKVGME